MGKTAKSSKRRFVRFGSPDSTDANYGSDPENDRIEFEEMREINEVADWLLQPPPPSPTFPPEDEKPFNAFGTPGALIYQLLHLIFVYLNLLPPCTPYPMPLPRKSTPRPIPPRPKVDLGILFGSEPPPPIHDDETEYIIHPTPGTDQNPIHISVTTNHSLEKLMLHNKGMLRIYRVPRKTVERLRFAFDVKKLGLCGDVVRMPVDEDDIVAVFRHGFRLWDFFQEDEVWYLVATNTYILRDVIRRCQYQQPPLFVRLTKPVWWSMRRLFSIFLPWVYPPGRPIKRARLRCEEVRFSFDELRPMPFESDAVDWDSD